jgi:hypothetical protein
MKPMVLIKTSDLTQDNLFHDGFLWFRRRLAPDAISKGIPAILFGAGEHVSGKTGFVHQPGHVQTCRRYGGLRRATWENDDLHLIAHFRRECDVNGVVGIRGQALPDGNGFHVEAPLL